MVPTQRRIAFCSAYRSMMLGYRLPTSFHLPAALATVRYQQFVHPHNMAGVICRLVELRCYGYLTLHTLPWPAALGLCLHQRTTQAAPMSVGSVLASLAAWVFMLGLFQFHVRISSS